MKEQPGFTLPPIFRSSQFLLMALIVVIGFSARTVFLFNDVFTTGGVRFQGEDAWYHVRLIENTVRQFPDRLLHDVYRLHPGGQAVDVAPFFDILAAFLALLAGLFSPSTQTIHTVAALLPPLLGGLSLIPVYFIGKAVFGRTAGLSAAAFLSLMPGGLFARSLLGFSDHHAAEFFFTAMTLMFLLRALKSRAVRPALLAGLMLGCYNITWVASGILTAALLLWLLTDAVVRTLSGRNRTDLYKSALPMFGTGLLITGLFYTRYGMLHANVLSLAGAFFSLALLAAVDTVLTRRNGNSLLLAAGIPAAAVAATLLFALLLPDLFERSVMINLRRFFPSDSAATVAEITPLLYMQEDRFSLLPLWQHFAAGIVLAPLGLVALGLLIKREFRSERLLLLISSTLFILAAFGQNRFTLYASLFVAVLTGGAVESVISRLSGGFKTPAEKRKGKKRRHKSSQVSKPTAGKTRSVHAAVPAIAVILVMLPYLHLTIDTARRDRGPRGDWFPALHWLRDHSPEPTVDAASYGIAAWWDYGYLITSIARRIPNSNPSQANAGEVARLLLAQNEDSFQEIATKLQTRYVLLESDTPVQETRIGGARSYRGKFRSIVLWAGQQEGRYFDHYYIPRKQGQMEHLILFYPAYYRTMSSRLYLFDGKDVTPENSTVVASFSMKQTPDGERYREVTSLRKFNTWDEANAFMQETPDRSHVLAGDNPYLSCVPLESLETLIPVYTSPTVMYSTAKPKKEFRQIKIFELLK